MIAALLPLIPVLAPLIPRIAEWIGGDDAEDVARQVTGVVTAVAGSTDPAAVAAVIAAPERGPELALGLARIAAEREKAREDAATARITAALADTADARRQTMALSASGSRLAWMPAFLTVGAFLGFFVVLWLLFSMQRDFAPGVREVLLLLIGAMVARFGQSYDYWMGTSRGAVEMRQGIEQVAHGSAPRPFAGDRR
jgi:hypothetical protein